MVGLGLLGSKHNSSDPKLVMIVEFCIMSLLVQNIMRSELNDDVHVSEAIRTATTMEKRLC